ncbi:pentatricopeptide repeat-containing protein At5g04780, mitochondrial [Nymphaea colorata]|uniref:pentatricopeptide repeat-containing protein At5g04780, mitochondrial n=1 Tax=Nymphaea colorata TaxID=210225 RepID=UPI00129D4247|nr:pentatricopeptide repeat-containing protein At5g04780, mitochondrial [Nymphaea colorata]
MKSLSVLPFWREHSLFLLRKMMNPLSFRPRQLYIHVFVQWRCVCTSISGNLEGVATGNSIKFVDDDLVRFNLQQLMQDCIRRRSISEGKICHAKVIQAGLQMDILMSNILINMYSRCDFIDFAKELFSKMPERSVVSWNTMIGAYTQNQEKEEALKLFRLMLREGVQPNEFTLPSIFCACATKMALVESRQLHAYVIKSALHSNVYVGTALLDVYAKCNLIKDSSFIFEDMPERSDVTWSSMIAGYVQNDLHEEALELLHRAQKLGLELTKFTLSSALSACASLAALIEGNQIHSTIIKSGLNLDLFVVASLVDMYAKSGNIEEAYSAFAIANERNIVLWNAMISGFSRHARCSETMIVFEKAQQSGAKPNEITYISVLSACGRGGFVNEARRYFDLMIRDCNVKTNVNHYACMVDVLGRAGMLFEADELIKKMPFEPTASMWGSLLGSCRIHGNIELAEIAAQRLFELEPRNAGNHVLLSNIYAANGKWFDVSESRKRLKDSGVQKEKGRSWVEVKDTVHTFVVGDMNHSRIDEIYKKLEDLTEEIKVIGYRVETDHDLHDIGEEFKEKLLKHHSEKLALSFALISIPVGIPIRIMKNLRVCGDCHSFMKLASKVTGRLIIMRDTNRFHHFKEGCCSCRDYW